MDIASLLIWLLIGAVAGWIAGNIMRGGGFGIIGNIIVGIVGAFLAGFILPAIGLGFDLDPEWLEAIIYGVIGAVILLFVIGLFSGRNRA